MRRTGIAALSAAAVMVLSAGAAFAAPPTITVVDISQFEAGDEEALLLECGFVVDVEYEGKFIVHEFSGRRLVEIVNYQMFQTFSANGKTFVAVHPDSGPDVTWVDANGTTYLAQVGRSSTGSGIIGRTVTNLDTDTVVSSHGLPIDNPLADICAMIAP